jgi:two-component sensor histidine kinase
MTTRTKQLLQRSRDLLERSRVAAVQLLDPPRSETTALPRIIEGSRAAMVHQEPEGAVVDICASIALRDLNLVDSLLSLLERMEETEADPDRLTELYKLDHLAARLRRNAENLRVLAGRDASDTPSDSASLVDVIRAAMSSIDGYSRVSIGRVLTLGVVGIAADDLSRLLAELLDNAAKQSPPDTSVRVSAYLTDSGSVLMRIEDDGIGLPSERVAELNSRLSDEPKLNDDSVRHMGLAVVRRLAARHEMRVRLDRRSPHGTTATVLLPAPLLCDLPDNAWSGSQTVVLPAATTARAAADHAVPAARRPSPRHAAEHTATTAGGLPKRNPPGGRVATRPPTPQDLTEGGSRTVNGLPRRVSRSIKNPDHGDDSTPVPAPPATPEEEKAGHEQLLADLDAFAAGEQAAKDAAWPAGTDPDAPPAAAPEAPAEPASAAEPVSAPETEAPEVATREVAAPENAAPENATREVAAPENAAPENAAPENAVPENAAREIAAPENAAPENAAPGIAAPEIAVPEIEAPVIEPVAEGAVPRDTADRDSEPVADSGFGSMAGIEPDSDLGDFGDFGAAPPYAPADDLGPAAEPEAEPAAEPPRAWARPADTASDYAPDTVSDYAPGSVFDAAADSTPTPPHGFPLPADPDATAPERGHDQPGGPTP